MYSLRECVLNPIPVPIVTVGIPNARDTSPSVFPESIFDSILNFFCRLSLQKLPEEDNYSKDNSPPFITTNL